MKKILPTLTGTCVVIIAVCYHLAIHETDAFHVSSFLPTTNPAKQRARKLGILQLDDHDRQEDYFQDDSKGYDDNAKLTAGEEEYDDEPIGIVDIVETQRLIQAQQKQIDMLMKLVGSTDSTTANERNQQHPDGGRTLAQSPSKPATVFSSTLPPLKAMLFIDGTWLYYSIHERQGGRDAIGSRFGKGWQSRYYVDWARLPRLICEALQEQDRGWSSLPPGLNHNSITQVHTSRPIEIVRAPVFTSYKAETPKSSFRYQMYEEMKAANYDLHMMETVGRGEKCVDIQLAVDMVHYATVPNAYDVALLLSGDKDFLPALVRTRQKGRRVGLVSMQTACNKALLDSPHVKDYNPVWLEDLLDELIQPRDDNGLNEAYISGFTIMKVVSDFISKSGFRRVSSRDIGRYLKTLKIGDSSFLGEMKKLFGGLYQFASVSGAYDVEIEYSDSNQSSHSFWVSLGEDSKVALLKEAKITQLNSAEKEFFESYSLAELDNKEDSYWYTMQLLAGNALSDVMTPSTVSYLPGEDLINGSKGDNQVSLPEELTRDYSKCTLAELKEFCRERGLPVSGKKAEVLERLTKDIDEEIERLKVSTNRSITTSTLTPEKYLFALVEEYIHASGGKAGSRDLGRYLAANKSSEGALGGPNVPSALQELKEIYGSLKNFVFQFDSFYIEEAGDGYEFIIYKAEALRAA